MAIRLRIQTTEARLTVQDPGSINFTAEQNIHLSNVQIDANEEVAVRVRSRGSNYYVGTLTIIEA